MVSHHGAFFGKTVDVFGLFLQKALGNEQREISVFVPCVFKHPVEDALHIFPDPVPPWLDDHAAAHRATFS